MRKETLNKKLDLIFEHYTQNQLADALKISQWELLTKMKDNSFDKKQQTKISKIYRDLYLIVNSQTNQSKEFIRDAFFNTVKVPDKIIENGFKKTKDTIQKYLK